VKRLRADLSLMREAKIHHILSLTPTELQKMAHDPSTKGLDAALSTILIKAINSGDPKYLGYLFELTVGPVQKNVKIELPDTEADQEKRERLKKLEEGNEAIIQMLKETGAKGLI